MVINISVFPFSLCIALWSYGPVAPVAQLVTSQPSDRLGHKFESR